MDQGLYPCSHPRTPENTMQHHRSAKHGKRVIAVCRACRNAIVARSKAKARAKEALLNDGLEGIIKLS